MAATPIGTNSVTAVSRRHIVPTIADQVYNSNLLFFRLVKANKKILQGGIQIEQPVMYSAFTAGGAYQGYDVLNITPQDTWQNSAFAWKQQFVPVTIAGLTLIQADQPDAIANYLNAQFKQSRMQMADNMGTTIFSDGITNPKNVDGISAAVDNGTIAPNYGGITRASNTWWNSQVDNATSSISLSTMQSMFGNCTRGGQHPTLIVTDQYEYNKYWALGQTVQTFPIQPVGSDEQLMQAGFTNLLFNNVPVAVDSHVPLFNGTTHNMFFLNEDTLALYVARNRDFYLQDFVQPTNQDAMTSLLLWAGNLVCDTPLLNGVMRALT